MAQIIHKIHRIEIHQYGFELFYTDPKFPSVERCDGFYRNLSDVIHRIIQLDLYLRNDDMMTLSDYIREYERLLKATASNIKIPINFGENFG